MSEASSAALPAAWWLFWWAVGVLATGMLVAWFLRGSRRAYRPPDAERAGGKGGRRRSD